jgi:hypothetical protein
MFILLLLRRTRPGNRWAYASALFLLFGLIVSVGFAGCSGSGNGSSGHTAKITAKYSGDTNYASSASQAITITIQ